MKKETKMNGKESGVYFCKIEANEIWKTEAWTLSILHRILDTRCFTLFLYHFWTYIYKIKSRIQGPTTHTEGTMAS